MALYDTVANVVSDTAVELGLGAVSDVFASTDANVVQLRTLLKRVGRHLAKHRQWKQLIREHAFTTSALTNEYKLPADFGAYIDQTGFNRTQNRPLHVVTPQEWQHLKASSAGTVTTILFRTFDRTLKVWPETPVAGETVAFEYLSRYWVGVTSAGEATAAKDAPTANTDVILFDVDLIMPALKLAWLQAKGFDTSAAAQEYNEALRLNESANEGAAPVLDLNRRAPLDRFLDMGNAGSSGFGGFIFDGTGGLY